ncbi:hypothetical protein [Streptomyces sp. IBTA2]|nr:hypothetical protein [Streptomyces sp. IBTA2]
MVRPPGVTEAVWLPASSQVKRLTRFCVLGYLSIRVLLMLRPSSS